MIGRGAFIGGDDAVVFQHLRRDVRIRFDDTRHQAGARNDRGFRADCQSRRRGRGRRHRKRGPDGRIEHQIRPLGDGLPIGFDRLLVIHDERDVGVIVADVGFVSCRETIGRARCLGVRVEVRMPRDSPGKSP